MGWLMGPIYFAISWILLRWHELFDFLLPNGTFLGTNWDWVLAIMFLVITVRVILFPIFVKQIRSQRAMQAIQPRLKELQQKHKGDQQTLREEMMKLYQTEKVNPLMGCLPMFLQIPVFLGLFHVLKGLNPADTRTRVLYGWTAPAWDNAVQARLFGAPLPAHFSSNATELLNLHASGMTVKIVAGLLVLIMMATTFATSRQMILKTGWSQDPQQRMIQKLMLYGIPFSLLVSGWYFPIGVIIYWVTQNAFSFCQQYYVLHKYPPPVTAGNIPMKSTRSTTPAPAKGLLARILPGADAGQTAPARPANGRTGFLSPAQPARSGLFRRKVDAAPVAPVVEAKALAPRPGAKPVHPGKQPSRSATPVDAKVSDQVTDQVSDATAADVWDAPSEDVATVGARAGSTAKAPTKSTPAKSAPAKSIPAKSVPAKPVPARSAPAKAAASTGTAPAKANGTRRAPGAGTPAKPSTNGSSANGSGSTGSAGNGKATNGAAGANGAAKRPPSDSVTDAVGPGSNGSAGNRSNGTGGSGNGSASANGSSGGSSGGAKPAAKPAGAKSGSAKRSTPRKGPAKKGGPRR